MRKEIKHGKPKEKKVRKKKEELLKIIGKNCKHSEQYSKLSANAVRFVVRNALRI